MDAVTHSLAALLVARLGFAERLGPRRAPVLALVAVHLPAVDVLMRPLGGERWALVTRGPTHGVLAMVAGGLVLGLLARVFPDRAQPAGGPLRWRLGLAWLALALHLVLDALDPLGAEIGLPWRTGRVALGWLWGVDPLIWLVMAAGLLAPLAGAGVTRSATGAVLACGFYVGLAGAAHGVVVRRATAWAQHEGLGPDMLVVAVPETPGGLFWSTFAADEEMVVVRPVDLLGPPRPAELRARGLEEPLVQEFLATPVGARWLELARVPVAIGESLQDGTFEVFARDLSRVGRFDSPLRPAPYDVWAHFDQDAEMLDHVMFLPTLSPTLRRPDTGRPDAPIPRLR